MRNLSKVLALVLAFTMIFGVLSVGAADFSDASDITAAEAVETLTALGVIVGMPDGSFAPNATVTRAEMAKMIFTIRNGGNSDATQYTGMATPFADVTNHWAKGYINYCYTMGIVNGKSATSFDPNAPVTGLEAAKMALVCLGYNAETAGLTGATWAQKSAALGSEAGLFEDFGTALVAGAPRQYAAQLLFNALDASTVRFSEGEYTNLNVLGAANPTLGARFMSLVESVGILETSAFASISGSGAKEALGLAAGATGAAAFTKVTKDYSALIGQEVKVLYKATDKVYGVFATDKNTVVSTVMEKVSLDTDTSKIKVGTTKYTLAVVNITNNIVKTTLGANATASSGGTTTGQVADVFTATLANRDYVESAAVKLISNNGNANVDLIVIYPTSVEKVTYYGADTFTLSATGSVNIKDANLYEGIKKDDYVVVTPKAAAVDDKITLAKAQTVSGTVDGVKGIEVLVNGTWYKQAASIAGDTISLTNTYNFAVAGTYIFNAKKTDTGSTEKVLFVDAAGTTSGAILGVEAKVYMTDGTSKISYISKVDGTTVTSVNAGAIAPAIVHGLFTYEIKNGDLELTSVSATNKAGCDDYLPTAAYSNKNMGVAKIADDAVVFVKNTTKPEVKVMTGAAVTAWGGTTASPVIYGSTASAALTNTSGGYKYVKIGMLIQGAVIPGASGDLSYGYLTDATYLEKVGSDYFAVMTIWNGSNTVIVRDTDATSGTNVTTGKYAKGAFVSYKVVNDTEIKTVTAVGTAAAVTAYDGASSIQFHKVDGTLEGTVKKVASNSKIIYVNTKDKKAVAGGAIAVASDASIGGKILNVYYVGKTGSNTDEVDVLFVDVNNDLDGLANTAGVGVAQLTVAAATTAGTTTGLSISTNKTWGLEGDLVTVTVTYDGTATVATTLTATVTGAGATVLPAAPVAITSGTAQTFTFIVTVGAANVTAITVTGA